MPNSIELTSINATFSGTASGAVLVDTSENGTLRFVPLFGAITMLSISAPVSDGSISIGTNSTAYDNIMAISSLSGLNTANRYFQLSFGGTSVAPGTGIYVKVTTPYSAGSASLKLVLFGYYQ